MHGAELCVVQGVQRVESGEGCMNVHRFSLGFGHFHESFFAHTS